MLNTDFLPCVSRIPVGWIEPLGSETCTLKCICPLSRDEWRIQYRPYTCTCISGHGQSMQMSVRLCRLPLHQDAPPSKESLLCGTLLRWHQ